MSTFLLETIKSLGRKNLNYKTHTHEYGKSLSQKKRYEPKHRHLAQEENGESDNEKDDKKKKDSKKTSTTQVIINPDLNSIVSPSSGPRPKFND